MAVDLDKVAKSEGIKYFLISFVDLFGMLRSKLVPARAIGQMQENGAGFAGFAAWLDMSPADPDMFAIPDADSLIQLPWKPEVAWLASDLWMAGKPVEASPRIALKRKIEKAEALDLYMKSGVECEYFLINSDGSGIFDERDNQAKPCYDQAALMRRYDIISEICDAMIDLGWNPYQNDHEDANGQFEMNWDYTDALVTADRHVFFKYMVKTVAENHGLRATFMPKPFPTLTGNGCHAHVSVWDKSGSVNKFSDDSDEMGLSKLAYQFLGGVMHNADSLAAVFNPTVNSYKRIDATVTLHPHGAHSGSGPLRAAPHGRRRQPLPASGRCAGRRSRRSQQRSGSGPAPGHQHVHRGPETAAHPPAAPELARRGAPVRQEQSTAGSFWR